MLDVVEDSCNQGYTFGSSPPNRPFVAEGSDLFRAVMEDLKQSTGTSRLTSAAVDSVVSIGSASSQTNSYSSGPVSSRLSDTEKYRCKRCLRDRTLCRCYQGNGKSSTPRVQWVDEIYDRPLAEEQCITDISLQGRVSPVTVTLNSVKPILKHRANCIIIVSE